ncbi:hypothetical protein AB0J86_05375 [Micromonospora sp. NPDC049559]|uniref:hypothetical protein n=1 Tax=Micromonospora sp. NPDC049559 TaxID=3155923 RepID=UPI003431DF42
MVHYFATKSACQDDLYLQDTYLTDVATTVAATGRDDTGTTWIALRHNIFHPQGGGQPADRGWLVGCEVLPVRHAATGLVVLHAWEGTGLDALTEGAAVHASVDPGARNLHAALHTAGHLVEAAGRTEGWTLAGNNHFPGQARIEFTAREIDTDLVDGEAREQAADRLRGFVDRAIAADVLVTADYDDEGRRIVRLGDLHAAPCGGTHVRSLADLAQVTISAVKQKKGRVRVSYTASHRPAQ